MELCVADDDQRLSCATYTHARRHPMVLGRIAGWTPPFQLTISQIGVLLASFLGLVWTWDLWARWLPGGMATAVVLGVPSAAAWAARRARVEGRSLPRAAVGFAQLLSTPRDGVAGGRPFRPTRTCWSGWRVVVEDERG
jgi:hypothetical protein